MLMRRNHPLPLRARRRPRRAGLRNCLRTGPDAPLVCVGDGSACGADADCCSGLCAGDGSCGAPSGVVAVSCQPDDAPCSANFDCCSYLCADDGACGLPVSSCQVDNDPCNSGADCCSGLCAGDGFCGIPQ